MSKSAIHPSQCLELRGAQLIVVHKLPENRWQLRNRHTGEFLSYSLSDLLSAYEVGDLVFQVEVQDGSCIDDQLAKMLARDLRGYPDRLVEAAENRQKYLKEIDRRIPVLMTKSSLRQISADLGKIIGDPHPPAPSTLHRSYKHWLQSGRDVRALIPREAGRGSRQKRLSPEVGRIVEEMVDKLYLRPERCKCTHVYDAVKDRIQRDNQRRSEETKITAPSIRCVYRAIAKRIPYEVMAKRHGKRQADMAFRCTGRGPTTTYPLERVQIDHTPADCIVIDDKTNLPLGRPIITTLLDEHTRCVLGIHIGFAPPSTGAVMSALKNAILPKGYVKTEFPSIVNEWPCFGVPWLIVCDNGKEFLGKSFQRACLNIGSDIQYTKPKVAYYKGAIERFQRRLNEENLHPAIGTTLSKYLDLATDYDPRKNAVVSLHSLREELHRWIIDIYHKEVHGMSHLPADEAWREGLQNLPIPLPSSARELDVILGRVGTGIVQHYGLQNAKLHYNSEALGALRREFGFRTRLEFIWNEEDLGHIYVQHPRNGEYLAVPAIRSRYASKLTLHQHKTVDAYRRRYLSGRTDEAASIEAKAMIQQKLSQKLNRRSRHVSKGEARYMYGANDTDQTNYAAPVICGQSTRYNPPRIDTEDSDSCNEKSIDSFPVDIVSHGRLPKSADFAIENICKEGGNE